VISAYVATKFAIEGLSESIAYELEPFGIKVILIERGAIGSNFMKGSVLPKRALNPQSPYSELVKKFSVKQVHSMRMQQSQRKLQRLYSKLFQLKSRNLDI
jgi:short-subunit dehydrogenase